MQDLNGEFRTNDMERKKKEDAEILKETLIQIQDYTTETQNDTFSDSNTSNIPETVQRVRDTFKRGVTKPVKWRMKQLKSILRMYEENMPTFVEAIYKDFRRPKFDAFIPEMNLLLNDVKHLINNLEGWAKPTKPTRTFVQALDQIRIYHEPYGVVLIIGTWNYPFQLSLMPVAGAIAGGNAVVLKPSELAVHCAKVMVDLLAKYLDKYAIITVEGGPKETTQLLQQKFDYIFFTGSISVGRIVYEAAAKFLTPVTLELGGKSPTFIDESADMLISAKRILWAKAINAGQTCIAPDYVLCTKNTQEKFLESARNVLVEWYGYDAQKSVDYSRIINNRQFNRLKSLIDASKPKISLGGQTDESDNFIEFTILSNVTACDKIMEAEIFGPILPIVVVQDVHEAIRFINAREKPLALHVFAKNQKVIERVARETSSGGIVVNDSLLQMGVNTIPFGGVGTSGMGAYHGRYTFDTFTHKKGCMQRDFMALGEMLTAGRYPPYSDGALSFLLFASRFRAWATFKYFPHFFIFLTGFGVAMVLFVTWSMVNGEQ